MLIMAHLARATRLSLCRDGPLQATMRTASSISLNPLRWFKKSESPESSTALQVTSTQPEEVQEYTDQHKNKFIPVTRRTLLNTLTTEKDMFNTNERQLMERFAASLDTHYSHRFYGILEEAKLLYDYLDPDKDTYQTRELSKKELLDQEYWLLQKVDKLLDKANYFQIPQQQLVDLLHDRDSEGVTVSVNPSDYDTLKFWTRGLEVKKRSNFERFKSFASTYIARRKDPNVAHPPSDYRVYTRVFVAVRSHSSKKLHLKVFKEVPCSKLEYLLPDGKIKMSTFDKRFLASSVILGGSLLALRSVPFLADWKVQWTYIGVGMAGFIGARAWIGYKNKRNHYLANLATTLYYKTVANNRGVLTLLADRAQDEEFKEAILAYFFLLSPRNRRGIPGTVHTSEPPIVDTPDSLQVRIEEWLAKQFSLQDVCFDIEDALTKLDNLGLLLRQGDNKLAVSDLEEALSFLPQPRHEWQTVGALRDSESSDEQTNSEETDVAQHGWR